MTGADGERLSAEYALLYRVIRWYTATLYYKVIPTK